MMSQHLKNSLQRWEKLKLLQEHYINFVDFLEDVMDHMGFDTTEIQKDIARFLEEGPDALMIQACRGIAKTTITAAYAVWTLIHKPESRIVIVTANGDFSAKISTLIIRLIMTMDLLECLRPESSNSGGDRDRMGVKAFDVHSSLRRAAEKDPSLACFGIFAGMTGSRADLLIADDVEEMNNSNTALKREVLMTRISEFSDICTDGRIVFLGTPQSIDSIYNSLPSKGFEVRVWTGRYPTSEQLSTYGIHLAPFLRKRIKLNPELCFGGGALGDQGKPTDSRINENILQTKELQKGTPSFQLQYMLNTTLSDKLKYPLKTENIVQMRLNDLFPTVVNRDPRSTGMKNFRVQDHSFMLSSALSDCEDFAKPSITVMYIDPAGGGLISQDETAYCVLGLLNGNVYLMSVGGIAGGYEQDKMDYLAAIAEKYQPTEVKIEKNMGYGAFTNVFTPTLRKIYKGKISEEFVSGQKEVRIANTLGPVIGRGSLIVTQNAIEEDDLTCNKYSVDKRKLYSFFFQLSKLTLQKNCLKHDDRLDCVAGAVNHFLQYLAIDQDKKAEEEKKAAYAEWCKNPTGRKNSSYIQPKKQTSTIDKYFKR